MRGGPWYQWDQYIYEIPRRIEANALSTLHNRGYHARELRNLYHGHPEN